MQLKATTAYIGVTNKLYPIFEFWHDGKPYFYTGACSVNKLKDCYVEYADLTLGIEVTQYGTADWHNIQINGRKVKMNDWPEDYIDKLPKFTFSTKQQAKLWGVKFGEPLRMVKQYADKTALFRFNKNTYRTLSLSEVIECNTEAKPKAATPKRRVVEHNREYVLNFGKKVYKVNKHDVCLNPDESVIFKNKQLEFIARVAFLEDAWRNGYKFTGKDWENMGPVTTIGDAFESEASALLDIGEFALKPAIDHKAPAAAIKAIREFISHNRQLDTVGQLVEDIEVNGINEAKTEEPEPIKTELVDGHQQIVLFDVPATEKKADPNAALFGYVAKNRTERQAFKRKLQRTTDWLDGLPADQRAAILKAIAAYTPPRKR